MIKLEHVMLLTERLQKELEVLKAQAPTALTDVGRWALFVTPKEINELMDESVQSEFFQNTMTVAEVQGIREMKGLWHVNGVGIFPELQERLDG